MAHGRDVGHQSLVDHLVHGLLRPNATHLLSRFEDHGPMPKAHQGAAGRQAGGASTDDGDLRSQDGLNGPSMTEPDQSTVFERAKGRCRCDSRYILFLGGFAEQAVAHR